MKRGARRGLGALKDVFIILLNSHVAPFAETNISSFPVSIYSVINASHIPPTSLFLLLHSVSNGISV